MKLLPGKPYAPPTASSAPFGCYLSTLGDVIHFTLFPQPRPLLYHSLLLCNVYTEGHFIRIPNGTACFPRTPRLACGDRAVPDARGAVFHRTRRSPCTWAPPARRARMPRAQGARAATGRASRRRAAGGEAVRAAARDPQQAAPARPRLAQGRRKGHGQGGRQAGTPDAPPKHPSTGCDVQTCEHLQQRAK